MELSAYGWSNSMAFSIDAHPLSKSVDSSTVEAMKYLFEFKLSWYL